MYMAIQPEYSPVDPIGQAPIMELARSPSITESVVGLTTDRSAEKPLELSNTGVAPLSQPPSPANLGGANKENISNSPVSGTGTRSSFKLRSSKPLPPSRSEKSDSGNLNGMKTAAEEGVDEKAEADQSSKVPPTSAIPSSPVNKNPQPASQVPVVAKKDRYISLRREPIFVFLRNIFGQVYAPAQAVWPSKAAVKAAYNTLPDEKKEAWSQRHLTIIKAHKTSARV
ncbi:hypothetical protein FA13DRAFT_1803080 [Coprinellus micaceus]|uniref:Uncharacterized protein n=1 Tax=Coprinellus micaceus TaxID=71717 RepID=A0A4Y7SBH6_COPMI|nr:hypothetical protein FA13DRAFT_1803080 [Coprinellus micaceus]